LSLFDPEPGQDPGAGAAAAAAPPVRGAEATGELSDCPARAGRGIRLRLELAYDGSGFRGFATQSGQRTVAGVLADAIATVVRHPIEVTCAGRTDAGVHALGQVAHVDVGAGVDLKRLWKSLNRMLAPAVVVRALSVAPEGFDARRSARARHYRYLVLQADSADPLLAPVCWHVAEELDLRAMRAGADALVGEHDFRAFCRRAPGTETGASVIRRVLDARWSQCQPLLGRLRPGEQLLAFDVSASSFCHQMVRSMVGTLVEVGRGRKSAASVVQLLRAGDRSHAMAVAPPHGLCLVSVDYA